MCGGVYYSPAVLTIEALASGEISEDALANWIEANTQPFEDAE